MQNNHTVMIKLNNKGQIQNRIEVHNQNIDDFKTRGFVVSTTSGQVLPQSILNCEDAEVVSEFDKLEARVKTLESQLVVLIEKDARTFWQKIKLFFQRLV